MTERTPTTEPGAGAPAPAPGVERGHPIATWLVRHRRSLYLAAAALAVLGVLALGKLSSGIYPDVAFPRISIIAEAGEDAVENVELAVTRPLEQTVSVVQNVRRVRSKTMRGACEMSVDFEPSADMRQALQDVRARIASIQGQLPAELKLTVERQMPSLAPVISFYVALDPKLDHGRIRDDADLTDWALLELKPRLARLRDVFLVTVQSHDVHEIVIEVKPDALVARNVSMADVNDAVQKSNLVGAVGRLDRDGKWFQVLVTGQFRSLADIEALAIPAGAGKVVRLGDVATVKESVADRTSIVTGDGKDAVLLNVFMRAGGRVTELSKNVTRTIADVKPLVPPAVSFVPVYDQADLVNESLAGVRDAILIGGVLSVLILFAFLRDLRATLIAAPSIPLAIVGTFAFMQPLGLTLNLMSLGGIAIAIGLVVDDAIVVVECIARHLHEGKSRLEAVDLAIREVAGAVIGSSLTTIVVFAPLVLLEGVAGQFMQALSVTLSIAIVLSLALSLTVIPVFALGRYGPQSHKVEGSARFTALHDRAARWVLGHKAISWAVLLVVLVLAWVIGDPGAHRDLLPEMDEGSFVIDTRSPVGTALPETDRLVRQIEDALKDTKEVRAFSRRTGQELGLFATEPWKGDILVSLKPKGKDRKKTGDDISDDLRDKLSKQVPQLELDFAQLMSDTLGDMQGNPQPIEVKIFGRDHRALADAVERARDRLKKVKGLVSISRGMSFGSPELFFRVDSAAAARRGIAADDVQKETRSSLAGNVATTMRWGERLVPVRVRWPDSLRFDVRWMEGIPVTRDSHVPLGSVSTTEVLSNANELQRENQQPMATVTARLKGIDLGEASALVREALKDMPLPDGARLELGGLSATQEQLFASFEVVLALSVFLVLALLVAQFRSFGRAAVIFLALPFSQVGGLLALRLANVPVNMSSIMGLIMLVGLVVKNGILLVDHADRLRETGTPLEDALVEAGRVRLRPILMTSLTAIAGLVPLALNLGSGAELQRPLAIAVIGGLSLSTVFTLAVVPLGTLLFARKNPEA